MLQLVGKHDAVIAAPPVCGPVIPPVVLTAATVWFVLLQVSGGLTRVKPFASIAVAVMVSAALPLGRSRELPPVAVWSEIESTAQVVNGMSALVALPAEAKNVVCPGVLAVACA